MSDQPSIPVATEHVSQTVNAHVREIIAAAERAAAELRDEVEQEALRLAARIREDAENEARQVRERAERQAEEHLADARARAQAFADGRIARIDRISSDLLAKAETIGVRLDDAVGLRQELEDLVSALRVAAQTAAAESRRPAIRLPRPPGSTPEAEAAPPAPAPAPPAPVDHLATLELPARPSFDDPDIPFGADAQVRQVARDLPLPPRPVRPSRSGSVPVPPPTPEPPGEPSP